MRAASILLCVALAGCATSDQLTKDRRMAVAAHAADIATTATGLALGAAEANPLGVALIPAKVIGYYKIKAMPPAEQPVAWSAYESVAWGAAANNVCVIACIATGGASMPLCPAIGLAAGVLNWQIDTGRRDRLAFDKICEEAKARNPQLVCVWND